MLEEWLSMPSLGLKLYRLTDSRLYRGRSGTFRTLPGGPIPDNTLIMDNNGKVAASGISRGDRILLQACIKPHGGIDQHSGAEDFTFEGLSSNLHASQSNTRPSIFFNIGAATDFESLGAQFYLLDFSFLVFDGTIAHQTIPPGGKSKPGVGCFGVSTYMKTQLDPNCIEGVDIGTGQVKELAKAAAGFAWGRPGNLE
ncbi:hypothetical protein IE81DRAFT_349098 [Ceraceosorus guamensis]|uniref:Uncharacterized protein n=1 Tax=Ceraceosorus guamensis TaxID=1522189 RepID=A0A316VSP5_9BASI|nr:hypothetical protein IE81DRAFT_349098 [Ceraceosorus guamensis]PWN40616.1 hypothetical protein IE81DRAFT_349098 [Ceraceosorus guamensis]